MNKSNEHPDLTAIVRLMTGERTMQRENREIVRHLLSGCPECRKVVLEVFRLEVDPAADDLRDSRAPGGEPRGGVDRKAPLETTAETRSG